MSAKIKIGIGHILTGKEIDYMFSIVNSSLTDREKAMKLYVFCNERIVKKSLQIHKDCQTSEVEKLEILMKIYDEYMLSGYFDLANNSYKCDMVELDLRLKKLNEAMHIVKSDDIDYIKSEKLLGLYKNSEELRRTCSLILKYGRKDKRIEDYWEALDNYDIIFDTFKSYEDKGIIEDVKYFLSNKCYYENYNYAKFVIEYYIQSSSSYRERDFYFELGINRDIFEFCVKTIQELDLDLHKKYLLKKERNNKIRCHNNIITISGLAKGIRTGVLPDGTPFDLLEFIKRVPFKYEENFFLTLANFMTVNNFNDYDLVMSYVCQNNLHLPDAFKSLNMSSVYDSKFYINGVMLTNDDQDMIIEYLRFNNIPVTKKTYVLARNKYVNGEISSESIRTQISKKDKKRKILIPSCK